jgi:hypothetical protein
MSNSKNFGSRSIRSRLEGTLGGLVFVATAFVFVGGTVLEILKSGVVA